MGDKAVMQVKQESLLTLRERLMAEAKEFNLFSNVFMSVALNDLLACQHVLRILTGLRDLKVKEIRIQHRISKITGHDAVLDVLAEDGEGRLYNIEVDRTDVIDHARRARFYGAMLDSECLLKGRSYLELPEVYVIYISEKDLWKAGCVVYSVKKYLNTDISYDDGQHILYVNAVVDDGTETAGLMKYFKTADPYDMSQGELSKRVHWLKCEKGELEKMCEVSERIYKMGQEDGREKGRREGKCEGRLEGEVEKAKKTAVNMWKKGYSEATIAELLEVSIKNVQQWLEGNMLAGQYN